VPIKLYESATGSTKPEEEGADVVPGVVIDNCDLINQGKVLVRIPSLDQEIWVRLSAPGGGSGAGLFYNPRVDDEVLVAISRGGSQNAYLLGGLWSTDDTPPVSDVTEAQTKRVFKTGLKGGVGHEMEFDDALQSIKIVTSTKQKITIDPTTISLENTAGSLEITLDNTTQAIKIKGPQISIEADLSLTLKAPKMELSSKLLTISSTGPCTVSGKPIKLN
jgi:uncharacterized protein involved in type VI secretion and phage assembly